MSIETRCVIKQFVKSEILYYTGHNDIIRWSDTPYIAKQFMSRSEAEEYLVNKHKKNYWGGIYEIDIIYIAR